MTDTHDDDAPDNATEVPAPSEPISEIVKRLRARGKAMQAQEQARRRQVELEP